MFECFDRTIVSSAGNIPFQWVFVVVPWYSYVNDFSMSDRNVVVSAVVVKAAPLLPVRRTAATTVTKLLHGDLSGRIREISIRSVERESRVIPVFVDELG